MDTASSASRIARRRAALAIVAAIALMVGACSPTSVRSLNITGPWARTSPAVAGAGAAYLTIQNTGNVADALLGGSSPAARVVEVHETKDMGSGTMGMQRVERLEIPAGSTVELKPGSYHLMLIDLARELKAGETIEITLDFEKLGPVKVTAEVRAG